MTNNKVKSYAERIERLLDERAAIDADIKDIYTEVKAADLKPKVLRKAIANKRRKTDAQFEKEVEEYAALLLALPGATYRGVAEQTGIPRSTLQRRVPKRARGTSTPHNPETGEITDSRAVEDDDGEQAGRGGATDGRHSVDPPKASEPESEAGLAGEAEAPAPITETAPDTPPSPAPEFGVGPGTNLTGESNDGRGSQGTGGGDEQACGSAGATEPGGDADRRDSSLSPRPAEPVADSDDANRPQLAAVSTEHDVGRVDPGILTDNADGMDIPPFLRRSA